MCYAQAAFGADFERDPVVQSQAGAENLTTLLSTVIEGFQMNENYPFIKVNYL